MSEPTSAKPAMPGGADAAERDRWRRVQDVFAAAVDLPAAEREALLARECEDETLRQDVAALLAAHDRPGMVDRLAEAFVAPAAQLRASGTSQEPRTLGRYTVLDRLGAGGMGVVYRARDERLGRAIALKCLPPHLGDNPAAKRRLLLEARAAAALEHPNVCTIYEIGETAEGELFIAMPLYEGETLQARLTRGPLASAEALGVARQIAAGLTATHASGIVHRDLKPSNVMLLPDGRLKILDFGVAKIEDAAVTASGPVGTIAYMSPEQARGDAVDHRTDIWALGVVLYEMLAGERPFRAENPSALIYTILTHDPAPLPRLREGLPPGLAELVATALAKSPGERHASMAAMSEALALVDAGAATSSVRLRRPAERRDDDGDETSVPPTAERRGVTVLATTVSDYAALVERLAPEELDEVVARVRDAAVDVTRRYGGLVNQAIGEEIVSLFGIPAGHEDDEVRAVRAAIDLHGRARTIATDSLSRAGLALAVQSGIHSGSAVTQRLRDGPRRFGVSGAPAQVAARLASIAGRDTVLISPECRRLVLPFVDTEPGPALVLSSDAPAVPSFRVTGELRLQSRLDAAERAALTPYTGRGSELSTIEALAAQARAGQGGLLLIAGEAGMGKSRLLYEARERLQGAGVRLLLGRCPSYGGLEPYLPFVEVLRDVLRIQARGADLDPREVAARICEIDASIEQFLPLYLHLLSIQHDEHPLPRHLHGEHLQAALLDALSAVFMLLARRAPVLLLLEDWHWADDASRAALGRLAEIVDSHPLAVVVTSRPEAGVLGELGKQGQVVRLGPLDRAGAVAIMGAVLGADRVSDALADRVYERTAGNPFFLEEISHTLLEEGAVVLRGGEAAAASPDAALRLPDSVQAVIRARLDRLDGDTREVLRVASVVGREFDRDLLVEALGEGVDPARALDRLRSAGLIQQTRVVPEPAYRFKHVLTHQVAYDSLLEHQRKALHGVVGRAIQRTGGRLDERAELLAHHFSRAESWREAISYGRLAAGRLRSLSQYADALSMLERVHQWLSHLPDDEDRRDLTADILLEQERLCETLGQRGRQQQIISALIALLAPHGASVRLAEAYLRQGDLLTLLKRFDAADRALGTVLRLSREGGDAALERNAVRSLGLLRWHAGRHQDALAMAERALAIDRERDDDLAVAGDLANVANIQRSLGEFERARVTLEQALEIPALAEDPVKMSYVLHNLANVHRSTGNLTRALEYLERANAAARAKLMPIQQSFHLTAIAHIHLQQGRIEDARRTYAEAVELCRRARHADGLAQSLRLLGELQLGLGQYAEALPLLREAAGLFAQLEDHEAEAQAWSHVAAMRERTEDWAGAAEAWTSARRLRQALGDRAGELDAVEGLARVARRTPGGADPVSRFDEALALAAALGNPRREAALHNTLGILEWERGRYDRALGHYEAGLRLFRSAGDRIHEGLMLNSVGVTLSGLHRHEEARTVLEESVDLNAATGQRLLEAHALAALGDVSRRLGRREAARACYERALALRRQIGDRDGEAAMRARLAGDGADRPPDTLEKRED